MSVITTQAETKALLRGRAQTNLGFDNLVEFIAEAEQQIIAPAMSTAEFAALQAAYDASPPPALLAAPYDVLLPFVQKATILYAAIMFRRESITTLGNTGTKETGTEETMPPRQWAFNTADRSLLTSADAALERLLEFLERNNATYTNWATSESRTFRTELLVNTPDVLSKTTNFSNQRTAYLKMRPYIVDAEALVISRRLGEVYYNELITQARDGNLTTENQIIYDLAQKASVNEALSRAVMRFSIKQNQDGSFYAPIIEDGNRKDLKAENEILVQIKENSLNTSLDYVNKFKAILNTSAEGAYPTYKSQEGVYVLPKTEDQVKAAKVVRTNLKTFGF